MPPGVYKRTKPVWNKGLKSQYPAWNKGTVGIMKSNQTSFKKGSVSAFKGKHFTEEGKLKISLANTGKKRTEEVKRKMSLARKGKPKSKEHKRKIKESLINRLRPYISKEKHWNWKGGISKDPYPVEFNKELKRIIRERDNYTCCLCGRTEREELEELNKVLSINHIDFDKNNCSENNLNTLCCRCNTKINREREYWTNYFQLNNI